MVQKIILENKYEFLKLTLLTKTGIYLRFLIENTAPFVMPLIAIIIGLFISFKIPLESCEKIRTLLIPFALFCASWFTPMIGKTLAHAVIDGLLSFWILVSFGLMIAITTISELWRSRVQKK